MLFMIILPSFIVLCGIKVTCIYKAIKHYIFFLALYAVPLCMLNKGVA